MECDLVFVPKARPISASGNAQGTRKPIKRHFLTSSRPRPLALAGMSHKLTRSVSKGRASQKSCCWSNSIICIVVAATHDTSYQHDAGGISASSRWLRSVSDDTTGRRRDIRSCTPAGVPAPFFRPHDRWCRFAQPPATRFDASGIVLIKKCHS